MIRGTTPIHEFKIPFDTTQIADLRISYGQSEKEIVVKCADECELDGNIIRTTLTQEETFKFDCTKSVMIQVRVRTTRGEVMSTGIITMKVGKCLNSEVL
jgi:hypothetical protein